VRETLQHRWPRGGGCGDARGDRNALQARLGIEREALLGRVAERNTRFFEEELEKLERWADDLKNGLEREVKDLDAEIRAAKRDAKLEASLDAKWRPSGG